MEQNISIIDGGGEMTIDFILHKGIQKYISKVMDNDEDVYLRYVRMYIQHEWQAEQYFKRTTCVIVGPILVCLLEPEEIILFFFEIFHTNTT